MPPNNWDVYLYSLALLNFRVVDTIEWQRMYTWLLCIQEPYGEYESIWGLTYVPVHRGGVLK